MEGRTDGEAVRSGSGTSVPRVIRPKSERRNGESGERSSGFAVPVIAILFAMAGIIAALVAIADSDDRRGGQRDVNARDDSYRTPVSNGSRMAVSRPVGSRAMKTI